MSIFEFDQELHNRTLYEEGHEDGFAKGEDTKLISLVCCKLGKGKAPEVIADELEEDSEEDSDTIKRICETANSFAPGYNVEAIYQEMQKNQRS